jgi:hypothetical protein
MYVDLLPLKRCTQRAAYQYVLLDDNFLNGY